MRPFTDNLLLKLLALMLSLLLFSFVRQQENSIQRGISVPVSLNVGAGMQRIEPPANTNVLVVVEGPVEIVETLQPSDITVEPDMTSVRPGRPQEVALEVRINRPERERDRLYARLARRTIRVHVETVAAKSFTVSTAFPGGVPNDWAVDGVPTIDPSEVTVSGPENALGQIDKVVAAVQLLPRETSHAVATLRAVDRSGTEIASLQIEPAQAQVTVRLQRAVLRKRLPVQPVWRGLPANVTIDSVTLEPQLLVVVGSAEALLDLQFLETPPINVTNAPGRFTATVQVPIPQGVIDMPERSVRVTIVTSAVPVEMPDPGEGGDE